MNRRMNLYKYLIRTLINVLSIIFLLDLLTVNLFSYTLIKILTIYNEWKLLKYLLINWLLCKTGIFVWHRYKVYKKLSKKKEDLLDKHGRLYHKFDALSKQNQLTHKDQSNELINLNVKQLCMQLRNHQITSIELIDTYQIHALNLFKSKNNCIGEIIYEADVYAILADTYFNSDDVENLSTICGIPIALEEIFPINGYDHTMGYTTCIKRVAEQDCVLVKTLRDCGAIPTIITSVKQKILSLTAENPIFGLTQHPTHPERACVSGTATLLAHNGCPLAIGGDLLGEARLSAAFCGLVAFKPTTGRISQKGLDLPIELPHNLNVIPSPMGHNVEDLVELLRSIWKTSLFTHDQNIGPIPFNETQYLSAKTSKNMKLGFYTGFPGLLNVSPSIERVMTNIRTFLVDQGHEVIEFTLPTPSKAYELVISQLAEYMEPETLNLIYTEGHGDVLVDYKQRLLHLFYCLPKFLKHQVAEWRARNSELNFPASAAVLRGLGNEKSHKNLSSEIENYTNQFFTYWNNNNLDALICPISPIPAPLNHCQFYVTSCILLYTSIYNLLGCPAATLPVGRVEKIDIELCESSIENKQSTETQTMFAKQHENAEGLPIGLQIIAKPWNDELVLGLSSQLQSFYRG